MKLIRMSRLNDLELHSFDRVQDGSCLRNSKAASGKTTLVDQSVPGIMMRNYLFRGIMGEKPGLVGITWCLMGYSCSKLVNSPACISVKRGLIARRFGQLKVFWGPVFSGFGGWLRLAGKLRLSNTGRSNETTHDEVKWR